MKRILIVDDIEENLYLLRVLLEGHDYEVEEARNGSEAIVKALTVSPDMVISDILMPIIDGYTLCRIWKADEGLKRAPFIFYTATYTDPRDEQLAMEMGADAFIVKPAEPDEFLRQVEAILALDKESKLASPQEPKVGDDTILKNYNEVLIRKLEHKMFELQGLNRELEELNQELEAEIAAKSKIEASLRESEERYRLIFENSFDAFFLTDHQGYLLSVNPAGCSMFGRSEAELRTLDRIDTLILADLRFKEALKTRSLTGIFNGELTGIRSDGTAFPIEVSSLVFTDTAGRKRTSTIIRDITDRKRAEEALRENEKVFRLITENMTDTIWMMDMNFKYTYVSPSLLKNRGYTFEEIKNLPLDRHMTPESYSIAITMIAEEMTPERLAQKDLTISRTFTLEHYRKDGSTFWAEITMTILRDPAGAPIGILGNGRDVTDRKRVEQALVESELQFRTLADSGQALIWTSKLDKKLDYFNKPWLTFTGRTFEQELGDGWAEGVHPDDLERCFNMYTSAFDRREPFSIVYRLRRHDGEYRWILDDGKPRYDTKGDFLGYIGHCLDFTERKLAEDTLRETGIFLNTLLEAIPAPVFYKDTEGRYIGFNKSLETFFGRSLKELVGKSVFDIAPRELAEVYYEKDMELFQNPGKQVYESKMKDANGVFHDVIYHKATFTDSGGRIRGLIGVILDITERKRAEEALSRLNQELEQRVVERTADLEKANRELESFSYTVSHDLRAPLRHISGFIEMFRREMGEIKNEKALKYMDVINASARRMGQLIDDLLAFSRLGRTELSMRTVDMEKLAEEVLANFSEEIGSRAVEAVRRTLPPVQGDGAMLRVVLTNLVSNAVKFTSRSATGKIEIGHDVIDGESVFYVKDNGAGFDMRYADKLFGVFHRLHSEQDFEGTGIGLATVKRIIHRHDGRVWAEGEVGRGACFYFSLPYPVKQE